MPPTPLALSNSIPVANLVVDADVRRQPKGLLLNTKGKRKETACQSPAEMRRAAGGSCDRAALSQGGFSTPSWVGSWRSCFKAEQIGLEFSCPRLACRVTGITSAQDSDTLQFTLPMEGRRRFIFFP